LGEIDFYIGRKRAFCTFRLCLTPPFTIILGNFIVTFGKIKLRRWRYRVHFTDRWVL